MNDPLGAVQTFIDLYQTLVQKKWTLEKSQYEFLAQRAGKSIDEIVSKKTLPASIKSYQDTFKKLKSEEQKEREDTEKLLSFQEKAAPDLLAKVSQSIKTSGDAPERFTLNIEGRTYLVCILNKHNGNEDGNWGIIINSNRLRVGLFQHIIKQYISSDDIRWALRNQNGDIILESESPPSGTVTVRTDFAGNFPPWSLELHQEEQRFLTTLLTSRRGVYLYMFILLAGILVFGLILTMRIVTHELELARMKSDFVSTVSHEFKSPLTSISRDASGRPGAF